MSDQYSVFVELADTWDTHSMGAPKERGETLRECADALRMMVDFKRKPADDCPRAPAPFRYCPDCDGSFPCQMPGMTRA